LLVFLSPILRVLSFLTRLPFKKSWFDKISAVPLGNDAAFLPLAGALIGILGAAIFYLAYLVGFSTLTASLFAVLGLVTITGALHEDGLADVADSFFADKGADKRLEIMKDSRSGVFGVFALIFSTGLRVLLLAEIVEKNGIIPALCLLIGTEAASRAAMVVMWYSLPVALLDETIKAAGSPNKKAMIGAVVSGFLLLVPCFIVSRMAVFPLICALILLVLSVFLFRALCLKKIGGYCGDALGAMQQIGTLALLTGANMMLGLS